jgi:hypothetical protein
MEELTMRNVKLGYCHEELKKFYFFNMQYPIDGQLGHRWTQRKGNGPPAADPTIRQLLLLEFVTPFRDSSKSERKQ